MSAFREHIPQMIMDNNYRNINIPMAWQLSKYFTKIQNITDFIRLFMIINYTYIDNEPVCNMFKLLYVPLSSSNRKRKNDEINEPTYIVIFCEVENLEKNRPLSFNDNVSFKIVNKLDEKIDTFSEKTEYDGYFLLKDLNTKYSLYYFRDNINFYSRNSASITDVKICPNYFENKTLFDMVKTIEDDNSACRIIETNRYIFSKLPLIPKNVDIYNFNNNIESFIFNNPDERFIELPKKPIEVSAINDNETFGYVPKVQIMNHYNESPEIPKATLLYKSAPSVGIVFANEQPELKPPLIELVEPYHKRQRYGGIKHKRNKKHLTTKKNKKQRKNKIGKSRKTRTKS